MKIGQFAKENQMTIDAVRHYMNLDLLLPVKQNGQYIFDGQCSSDLLEVKNLKSMGFSLSEVQSLMLIQRMARHTAYEKEQFYLSFFERRIAWIEDERKRLKEMKKSIEGYLGNRKTIKKLHKTEGVPLEALGILSCNKCKGQLTAQSGVLHNGQIISGEMTCACGEHYRIEEGILMAANTDAGYKSQSKETLEGEFHSLTAHLLTYLQETHYEYLSHIVQNFEWLNKVASFNQKVALELGSGSGFFLRYFLDQMPKDSIYIAVDHDYERIITLKNTLDGIENKPKILYICMDFLEIPLKDQTVDLFVDYAGTSNYGFEHKTFLFDEIKSKLLTHCVFISSFILFQNFVYGSRIPEAYRHQFTEEDLLNALEESGYRIEQMTKTDTITKGGRFEDYFLKGERIYSITAIGNWA